MALRNLQLHLAWQPAHHWQRRCTVDCPRAPACMSLRPGKIEYNTANCNVRIERLVPENTRRGTACGSRYVEYQQHRRIQQLRNLPRRATLVVPITAIV